MDVLNQRSSGILLHVTSLPDPSGIGSLGRSAVQWIDWLRAAGQSCWQILPLSPTLRGDSPYSSYSAFAGNPLLIDLEHLVDQELLGKKDLLPATPSLPSSSVDFEAVRQRKLTLLRNAYEHFVRRPVCQTVDRFEEFCVEQRWWLDDFALFTAAMHHFETDQWPQWPAALAQREAAAISHYRTELAKEIEFQQFLQFQFFDQWRRLKHYANSQGVAIFGDMPIFVAHGSADVWANQNIFLLESSGKPSVVAGVPPDYFSKTGQLWGNPLYNWQRLAESNYLWWTLRFKKAFEMYDLMRIDHFRGFEAYWEIPAKNKTAVSGRWVKGPQQAPFEAAQKRLGNLPIVAEDLGLITEEVHQLRDQLGFPGMRVLQFGYDSDQDNFHRPEAYPANSVAYTGTHDNETIMGWFNNRNRKNGRVDMIDSALAQRFGGQPAESEVHWQLLELVLQADANLAVFPMQDVLGLGNEARMNMPGQAEGNWSWCMPEIPDQSIAARLFALTQSSKRTGNSNA